MPGIYENSQNACAQQCKINSSKIHHLIVIATSSKGRNHSLHLCVLCRKTIAGLFDAQPLCFMLRIRTGNVLQEINHKPKPS